jgi:serine protease Do
MRIPPRDPAGLRPVAIALAFAVLAVPGGSAAPAAPQQAAAAVPSFADLVANAAPAVVRVSVEGQTRVQEIPPELRGSPLEEFFRRFGGAGREIPRRMRGQGSGFIVDPAGFVVTNNHVVGQADRVTVELSSGRQLRARVIGGDPQTDIALLKIESEAGFPTVPWGNSEALRVGEPVLAMGNPFGLGGSATSGIVSARGRQIGAGPYDDFIQTDAPINPGSSGGPLFNIAGEVVGVNTAIFSPSGGNIGIGFAVPSSLARRVVEDLREHGRVERGWLGVSLQPLDRELAKALGTKAEGGALIAATEPDTPAARGGLQAGDVVIRFGDRPVRSPRDLATAVADAKPGDQVIVTISRDGNQREQRVVLGAPPDRRQAAAHADDDAPPRPGAFGMALGPSQDGEGVAVTQVRPGSIAEERGLRAGDVILRAGAREVRRPSDIPAAVTEARKAGRDALALQVQREGGRSFIALPLGQDG